MYAPSCLHFVLGASAGRVDNPTRNAEGRTRPGNVNSYTGDRLNVVVLEEGLSPINVDALLDSCKRLLNEYPQDRTSICTRDSSVCSLGSVNAQSGAPTLQSLRSEREEREQVLQKFLQKTQQSLPGTDYENISSGTSPRSSSRKGTLSIRNSSALDICAISGEGLVPRGPAPLLLVEGEHSHSPTSRNAKKGRASTNGAGAWAPHGIENYVALAVVLLIPDAGFENVWRAQPPNGSYGGKTMRSGYKNVFCTEPPDGVQNLQCNTQPPGAEDVYRTAPRQIV